MTHVRCCACRARRTLTRHPDSYSSPGRVPKCRTYGCNSRRYWVDHYRQRHEVGPLAPRPCTCHWYSFPHFKGRGYCIHNPSITLEQAQAREAYA